MKDVYFIWLFRQPWFQEGRPHPPFSKHAPGTAGPTNPKKREAQSRPRAQPEEPLPFSDPPTTHGYRKVASAKRWCFGINFIPAFSAFTRCRIAQSESS